MKRLTLTVVLVLLTGVFCLAQEDRAPVTQPRDTEIQETPADEVQPADEVPADEVKEAVEGKPATIEDEAAAKRQGELFKSYERLARVMEIVESRYVRPVETDELFKGALKGILESLDPYSSYIPQKTYNAFVEETEQQFSGIGVTINVEDKRIKVISTLEGMPASRAGVHPGDFIVKVDGVEIRVIGEISQIARRLRGARGTKVEVTLYRPSTEEEFTVTLERSDIPISALRGYRADVSTGKWDFMMDPKLKIGYVRITKFAQNTAGELDVAYKALAEQGLEGLIIDLRYNPGGLLDAAVALVDRFIDQGLIVRTKGRGGIHSESFARPYETYDPAVPLVLLINEYSASASEVMGGALQDYNRAVLVGTRTFGKGSVQNVLPLDGAGAIRLTVAYYYTPSGRLVHRIADAEDWGLVPDVVAEMSPKEQIALREEWVAVAGGAEPKSMGSKDAGPIDTQLARAVDILHGALLIARDKPSP